MMTTATATAFNSVEMWEKKTYIFRPTDRQTDRQTAIGRVDASAHQKKAFLCFVVVQAVLFIQHSFLHLFTCWLSVCVYRKLAARILPLELSASPSLALALIGRLIASDSFKEQSQLNGRVASTNPYSHLILSSPYVHFCMLNKLTVAQILSSAYVSGIFTQTGQVLTAAGHVQRRERGEAEITFSWTYSN